MLNSCDNQEKTNNSEDYTHSGIAETTEVDAPFSYLPIHFLQGKFFLKVSRIRTIEHVARHTEYDQTDKDNQEDTRGIMQYFSGPVLRRRGRILSTIAGAQGQLKRPYP